MGKNEFRLPPLSPLIGSNLKTFNEVVYGKQIEPGYRFKVFLSRMVVLILSPLRYYEKWASSREDKQQDQKPLFILGHWRSGTTYLHNMLCQDPDNNFVSTYQTVFPNYMHSERLLKPLMSFIMPSRRPSDNIPLAPDKPQEEEFAMSNLTEHSFYHFFYFPRHVGEYYHKYVRFDLPSTQLEQFQDSYRKVLSLPSSQNGSRLVVKNPVNTGRMNFLHQNYPKADYIHIYRNPYNVFMSTKKFFTELMPTLWFQKISEDQTTEMILDLYLNLYDDYFSFRKSHPEVNVLEVDFEGFESNPLFFMEKVYGRFFDRDFEKVKPIFESYIESQKHHKKVDHSISRKDFDLVSTRWAKYIEHWNYKLPSDVRIV